MKRNQRFCYNAFVRLLEKKVKFETKAPQPMLPEDSMDEIEKAKIIEEGDVSRTWKDHAVKSRKRKKKPNTRNKCYKPRCRAIQKPKNAANKEGNLPKKWNTESTKVISEEVQPVIKRRNNQVFQKKMNLLLLIRATLRDGFGRIDILKPTNTGQE